MSRSIRFLGVAVLAWAGVRAVSLGLVPGTQALAFDSPRAVAGQRVTPIQATSFPPIEPVAQAVPGFAGDPGFPPTQLAYPSYVPYPVYVAVPASARRYGAPVARPADHPPPDIGPNPYFAPVPPLESFASNQIEFARMPARQSTPSFDRPRASGFDRIQLSSWAMMRARPGAAGLASGGQLGGSQGGARLLWHFDPRLSASLRTSAPIDGQRGGEAALGLRYQPFTIIPVAFTAERRQSLGRYGGRSAFAVFAEGGLYGQSMPLHGSLDAYLQAGLVGAKNRDWFVDGSAAVTRPVWRNFSAGFGLWGGAQPRLARIDAGPRVSMRVGRSMRVHLDYRAKLAGNAEPGSGGVVTLAGDF